MKHNRLTHRATAPRDTSFCNMSIQRDQPMFINEEQTSYSVVLKPFGSPRAAGSARQLPRCFDLDATTTQTRIMHQIVCFSVERIASICSDGGGASVLLNVNASSRNALAIQPAGKGNISTTNDAEITENNLFTN